MRARQSAARVFLLRQMKPSMPVPPINDTRTGYFLWVKESQ